MAKIDDMKTTVPCRLLNIDRSNLDYYQMMKQVNITWKIDLSVIKALTTAYAATTSKWTCQLAKVQDK